MPTIPCSGAQNCLDAESPVANLSAEGVDVAKCFRYAFTESSAYTCEFDLSLCTAFAAFGGDVGSLCSPPPSIINGTNPPAPIVYSSAARSCTVDCGDFTSETYTVVAGTFVATSQAGADALATAFACQLAQMLCVGPLPPLFTNTAQSCTVICPNNSNFTYTTPASFFTAISQAEANLDAYLFACDLAALLCSGLPPGGGSSGAGTSPPVPQTPLYGNAAQECSATCPNGSIYTFTAFGNTFLRESRAAADAAAKSFACQQANLRRSCLSDLPNFLCLDEFSGEFIEAVGMSAPINFSVSDGALPPGITFDADGFWQGVPTVAGDYSFQLTAVDSDGSIIDRLYNVTVGGIDNVVLADADMGVAYSEQLTAGGFTAPVTWAVVSGTLPDGIVLDSASGLLSGTPTASSISAFTIAVTDGSNTCSRDYTLEVIAPTFCANLVWGAPGITPSAPVAGTGSANASECVFHLEATAPGFPDSSAGNQVVQIDAQQFYTGAAINLNLHLIVSGASGNLGNSDILITLDGNPLVIIPTADLETNGTYDYPFTIPISVAADFIVQTLMVANGSSGAVAGVWDGTFSIVP